MSLYTIGDLHLSLGTDKPMDVFDGWDSYFQRLNSNWNRLITDDDTIVIAGDVSWAMKLNDCYNDFDFLNSLPGKKIMLKGNHDYWWGTKKKMDEYLSCNDFSNLSILFNNSFIVDNYAICGTRGWAIDSEDEQDFKVLSREVGRLKASLESVVDKSKEIIVFLHYPPIYGTARCEEIIDVMREYGVKKCYYGHLHGKKIIRYAFNGVDNGIEYKVISADSIDFTPYLVR